MYVGSYVCVFVCLFHVMQYLCVLYAVYIWVGLVVVGERLQVVMYLALART